MRSAWPRASSSQSSSTTRPSPWRSRGVNDIPRKSNSRFAPALDDREVVVEVRIRVGVADDDPAGSAPSSSKIAQLGEAHGRQDRVGRDREAGPPRGPGGRPMDALLGGRDPRLVRPDLADDPRPDARLPHPVGRSRATSSSARSSTDRRSIERVRRVVRRPVPAAAHDDVEAAGLGQAAQPGRVAPDARQASRRRGRSRRRRGYRASSSRMTGSSRVSCQ